MPGGRPSMFTPEARERILQAISVGAHLETAAQVAGVSYSTFNRWMQRGEREKRSAFAQFTRDVHAARARLEVKLLAVMVKAAMDGDWRAATRLLECLNPKAFGRRQPEPPDQGPTLDVLIARAADLEIQRHGTLLGKPYPGENSTPNGPHSPPAGPP